MQWLAHMKGVFVCGMGGWVKGEGFGASGRVLMPYDAVVLLACNAH